GIPDSMLPIVTLPGGFASAGDHKVKVTATTTEADGTTHLSASDIRLVHVHTANFPPTIDFVEADPLSTPLPGSEALFFSNADDRDGDSSALTYDWDFGDSTPHATVDQPTHTFAAAGNYVVKLTVSDGEDTATQSVAVNVHGANRPPLITEADSSDF